MKGKNIVFKDLLKYIPRNKFDEFVRKHGADKWCKNFFCWDLLIVLLNGQLNGDMSLRTVELSHRCQSNALKQLNVKSAPLSTLSDACRSRGTEVFMDIFEFLVGRLQNDAKRDKDFSQFIHMIDSTPIPLKGYGYEWVKDNYRIKGLKVHTVYDSHLKSPIHFTMTAANVNDITEGKQFPLKAKGIYVFDKGYYDFSWWEAIAKKGSYFVTGLKKDTPFKIKKKNSTLGQAVLHDWTIELSSQAGSRFRGEMRHIRVALSHKKTLVIVSNDFEKTAEEIADLYKKRWEIELFFKCLKQNLKIKRFWGKNENAVKLQIITAMIAYVLLRLVQICTQSKLSLQQVRLIIRIKLYERDTVYKVLKIPDKHHEQRSLVVSPYWRK
jgi:hypothetical protein